ncbi:MAG: hypothetical protein Q9M35_01200 [Rhodothermus sp.]|nr:hypothetical protein [Rhodothermus sp.]
MALKWFGGGGYELFKHKFVDSLNQELVKLKAATVHAETQRRANPGAGGVDG